LSFFPCAAAAAAAAAAAVAAASAAAAAAAAASVPAALLPSVLVSALAACAAAFFLAPVLLARRDRREPYSSRNIREQQRGDNSCRETVKCSCCHQAHADFMIKPGVSRMTARRAACAIVGKSYVKEDNRKGVDML